MIFVAVTTKSRHYESISIVGPFQTNTEAEQFCNEIKHDGDSSLSSQENIEGIVLEPMTINEYKETRE